MGLSFTFVIRSSPWRKSRQLLKLLSIVHCMVLCMFYLNICCLEGILRIAYCLNIWMRHTQWERITMFVFCFEIYKIYVKYLYLWVRKPLVCCLVIRWLYHGRCRYGILSTNNILVWIYVTIRLIALIDITKFMFEVLTWFLMKEERERNSNYNSSLSQRLCLKLWLCWHACLSTWSV